MIKHALLSDIMRPMTGEIVTEVPTENCNCH